jgi:Zn-dependent M28 family amino/carboxypeptidase
MNKYIIALIVIFLVLINISSKLSCNFIPNKIPDKPSPSPQILKELTRQQIINLIKQEDIKQYVETLSSKEYCGRKTGTEGNIKAAQYIKDHLNKLNILYKEQEFTARGVKTKNIIAYIVPPNVKSENILVIGAHFDHLGGSSYNSYYPGADDNASGVAGVMAIATALSKHNLNNTILLQFYSAEEIGLVGSKYYTNNPLFPLNNPDINKHIAMINLDMIGYLKSNYTSNENTTTYRDDKSWTIYDYNNSVNLKKIVSTLNHKYPFATNISGYRPGGSDHAPFYNKGIPVVFLHTGLHNHYHKQTDTSDRLNYNGLVQVTKLALEIILEIDKTN